MPTSAEVFDIYEASGAHIGEIPISPQQRTQLHAGGTITIMYHTPRMLQGMLGQNNGTFEVTEVNGQLIVSNADEAKRYIGMQLDIARAMKQPDKWTDPDAESDSPIR